MEHADVYVPPQRIGIRKPSRTESARAQKLAAMALAAFGLDDYSIADIAQHSNLTARLVCDGQPTLALRLRTEPGVDACTEFAWLTAVRGGTTLRVIEPFADTFAESTRVLADPDGRRVECALFRWADGVPLAAELSPTNYHELGRMTAELHSFASSWSPPPGLKPLVWDRTLYYEGTSLAITDPRYRTFVSRREAGVVEAVVRMADEELHGLSLAPDRMFLHGNIEMWNVLTTGPGELRLLDFEDVMFGAPIQDVAITLYYGRERADHPALSEAYEEGYRSVREWPAADARQITLLIAARAAMLLNHALLNEPAKRSVTGRLLPLILAAGQ